MADIDARISIHVANDNLRATADYYPSEGEGKLLTREDVFARLAELGIVRGIKEDGIAYLCESTRPLKAVALAEAAPPTAGENARIEQYVSISKRKKVAEREDGSVDFRDLGEIASVCAGQKLYRRIPPTVGNPGVDIMDNELPGLLGKDITLIPGRGAMIDPNDPDLVVAAVEGELIFKDGVLNVSEIHTVKGDIDFSTGNLQFKGSVKIGGTLRSGFTVEAGGSVQINGNVEDASVISGADVTILGGFAGSGQGKITAKRDVFLKFVENQRVDAGRDIIMTGISYHAMLRAGRSVLVKGGKGAIIGGQTEAKYSVESARFGSAACVPTVLKTGLDPMLAERLKILDDEIAQAKAAHEKLEQSIIFIYKIKIDHNGKLPPDKQALLEKLEATRKSLPGRLDSLKSQREQMLRDQENINNAFIAADIGVFPKVRVYIGNQWIAIEDNLGPSTFRLFEGAIIRLSK